MDEQGLLTSPLPPLDTRPVQRLLAPFAQFAELEVSSSLLLLVATVTAIALANTPAHGAYEHMLALPLGLAAGRYSFTWPLTEWVNSGLMAVFFLVVGLEVKRELLIGELATFQRAILPVLAAAGGMLAPALIFLGLNHGGPAQRGWGVPVATDIAFSLAILTALGRRVPLALRVFLASLAIADDLGGILVIAIAYTASLQWRWLLLAGGLALLGLLVNRLGTARLPVYFAVGLGLWLALLASGIHPTIAGVVLALLVPSRNFLPAEPFVERGHLRLERFRATLRPGAHSPEAAEELGRLHAGLALVQSPLDRMERALHPWVSYGIMPLFALTNAGIPFRGFHAGSVWEPAFLGVALGLLLGKPLGITVFSWLAVRLRVAELPRGVSWAQLHGASWVAGIGFTVAIFVAGLAFGQGARYTDSRIAILLASTVAGAIGALLLRIAPAVKDAKLVG